MPNTFTGGFFNVSAPSRQTQRQSAYTKPSANPSSHLKQIAAGFGKIGKLPKMPCAQCASGKKNCC